MCSGQNGIKSETAFVDCVRIISLLFVICSKKNFYNKNLKNSNFRGNDIPFLGTEHTADLSPQIQGNAIIL